MQLVGGPGKAQVPSGRFKRFEGIEWWQSSHNDSLENLMTNKEMIACRLRI
jgi:hypothetical protein